MECSRSPSLVSHVLANASRACAGTQMYRSEMNIDLAALLLMTSKRSYVIRIPKRGVNYLPEIFTRAHTENGTEANSKPRAVIALVSNTDHF